METAEHQWATEEEIRERFHAETVAPKEDASIMTRAEWIRANDAHADPRD